MYASVKNYNIQKYEKAGDDEGDLLPFLNNPFSAHSVLPFEDWVVVIIRKTKNQDFKNEKSKKTANDLLIAFIV